MLPRFLVVATAFTQLFPAVSLVASTPAPDFSAGMPAPATTSLLGVTLSQLETALKEMGEPAFRAKQVHDWVFKRRVTSFDQMTNLPAGLRQKLATLYSLRSMAQATVSGSTDTTRKYLLKLHDGRYVETVLIPANPSLYGEQSDRLTLCVSSQVGCAYDCKFCASGLAGFTRNLTAGEIVEQIIQVEEIAQDRIDNLVFMGMGEPLANFTNLLNAVEILNAPWGVGIGARHMTISTSGVVPNIKKLADFPLQVRLAISLHGATDPVRDQIMPVNKKYPLAELHEALRYWHQKRKQHLTLEFILIEGVNDSPEQAQRLAKIAYPLHAKVNLIPYNTVEGLPWIRPAEPVMERFYQILTQAGVTATLRREKGHDIAAACGQLRLKQETAEGIIEAIIPEKRITIRNS
jgi:23S rRNA (adenine2503-C2)-methyltransferase